MLKEKAELEALVLSIIDRAKNGQHIEDSTVELKSSLIEAIPAARRIAAHANSALGQTIIWIIGLSEQGEVLGVDNSKINEWFAKVKKEFDEVYPEIRELILAYDSKSLLILQIKTDRAPYLTRNPKYGQVDSGPVEWEVPVREGTSVRTARRSDLVRLLASDPRPIEFEFLSSQLSVSYNSNTHKYSAAFTISTYAYLQYKSDSPLTIPFHKIDLRILQDNSAPKSTNENWSIHSQIVKGSNISGGDHEVIIFGPGKLIFQCHLIDDLYIVDWAKEPQIYVEMDLFIYEKQKTITIKFLLAKEIVDKSNPFNNNIVGRWSLRQN